MWFRRMTQDEDEASGKPVPIDTVDEVNGMCPRLHDEGYQSKMHARCSKAPTDQPVDRFEEVPDESAPIQEAIESFRHFLISSLSLHVDEFECETDEIANEEPMPDRQEQ